VNVGNKPDSSWPWNFSQGTILRTNANKCMLFPQIVAQLTALILTPRHIQGFWKIYYVDNGSRIAQTTPGSGECNKHCHPLLSMLRLAFAKSAPLQLKNHGRHSSTVCQISHPGGKSIWVLLGIITWVSDDRKDIKVRRYQGA